MQITVWKQSGTMFIHLHQGFYRSICIPTSTGQHQSDFVQMCLCASDKLTRATPAVTSHSESSSWDWASWPNQFYPNIFEYARRSRCLRSSMRRTPLSSSCTSICPEFTSSSPCMLAYVTVGWVFTWNCRETICWLALLSMPFPKREVYGP